MFYHIFDYLEQFDFPGAGMFQYITFRSACAVILSLLIATVVGKRIIRILQKQQVGEEIRDLGLEGQMQKKGTPTMGGVIILLAILVPVILYEDRRESINRQRRLRTGRQRAEPTRASDGNAS